MHHEGLGEESRITNSMLSEIGKEDADKGKMVKDYQELMAIQDGKKKDTAEKEEKKESIFEKIFESVKDLLPNLAGLAGIATLLYALFKRYPSDLVRLNLLRILFIIPP